MGDTDICNMWKSHFDSLYNFVPDSGVKESVYDMIDKLDDKMGWNVIVNDVRNILARQKRNRSPGPNGVCMEVFMYGGLKLLIHLSLFFLHAV